MKIVIEGDPIPKKRARHARRGNYVVTYDEQSELKNLVKWRMKQAIKHCFDSSDRNVVIEASNLAKAGAFEVSFVFYFTPNESDTEAQRNAKLWGFELHNKKPDNSNLLKFYEDCANDILFPDDAMIVKGDFIKKYSTNPRTEITIMPMKPLSLHPKAEGILKVFGPERLKEFLDDAAEFKRLDPSDIENLEGDRKELWLSAAASLLSKFAEKYADNLKKIKKFDGLSDDKERLSYGKPLC